MMWEGAAADSLLFLAQENPMASQFNNLCMKMLF